MSYTKLTDFAVKDSLPPGDGDKLIRGSEIDAEFNSIQIDSALKAPIASPTFTGTVTLPTGQGLVSPTFTGTPTTPTPGSNINTTQVINAQWVGTYYATINSPTFTGVPTVPTAAPGTNTDQIASTAFVVNQAFTAALPSQTGNAGKFVTTNGTVASWSNLKTINGISIAGAGDINGPTVQVVYGTTQTAVAGAHYILTNVAATTVTLPASPASGDTVWVTWTNNLATNVIARNGQTIMGLAEDMILDASNNNTVQLRFVNSSWRLV